MGGSFSTLCPCLFHNNRTEHDLIASPSHRRENNGSLFVESEPLDETLGHSFCYVRSSARFLSPTPSDRFLSPTPSLRLDDAVVDRAKESSGFRAISGAAVSANSFTPKTVLQLDSNYDFATDANNNNNNNVLISGNSLNSGSSYYCANNKSGSIVNGLFESTSLFSALPLQPAGRAGQGETGFFMSGPLERGTFSGPLDPNATSGGGHDHVPFSAPLGGFVKNKKRRKGISGIRKKFYRGFPEKKQPWVVPVLNFVGGRKEVTGSGVNELGGGRNESGDDGNVQWALGKAGEDRVHVVVSEEHGCLFVGIYDGFNGPDAPEFLMAHLYRALYGELQGLFWEVEDRNETNAVNSVDVPSSVNVAGSEDFPRPENVVGLENVVSSENAGSSQSVAILDEQNHPELVPEVIPIEDQGTVKRVTFEQTEQKEGRRRRLWEFLAEDDPGDGLDLSGSERFAFSLDDAISVSNAGSAVSRRWLLLSKLRLGLLSNNKHKEGHVRKSFPWSFGLESRKDKDENEDIVEEKSCRTEKKRKVGPVDHELVLNAMSRALEATEAAYLDMTDKFLDRNPELALMGSCLLVVLMRDEDVYVMNVGDSRAIVAYCEHKEVGPSIQLEGHKGNGFSGEGIVEMSAEAAADERVTEMGKEDPVVQDMKLSALQLSTDHSTSIEEEVIRIRNEHPDDNECILNDRVKGRLKVTRAFGAGFLKQPKWNDPLLEMFRNEYIGTAPYISCTPSLRHHKLCPRDQFLILSSDGLYQYLTNQEVVSYVESFMEKCPDGDPAQHLIEELLSRAAKKAGMDLQELLDIPQGDRRKYHDDVTVMVVSLEGRIWKSSGKYF